MREPYAGLGAILVVLSDTMIIDTRLNASSVQMREKERKRERGENEENDSDDLYGLIEMNL